MKSITASDRSSLIKLARTLPQGDETRKAILAGLKKVKVAADGPDPKKKYKVNIGGQGGTDKGALTGKTVAQVEKLISNFESAFEKFEEHQNKQPDEDSPKYKAWEKKKEELEKKMEPFYEGCDVSIEDDEGNEWLESGGEWEKI